MALLGTFILAFGLFGFNPALHCGHGLAHCGDRHHTMLAGAAVQSRR